MSYRVLEITDEDENLVPRFVEITRGAPRPQQKPVHHRAAADRLEALSQNALQITHLDIPLTA